MVDPHGAEPRVGEGVGDDRDGRGYDRGYGQDA